MSTWSPADPGAGDLSNVRRRMATLAEARDHAASMQHAIQRILSTMTEVWSGVAQAAWESDTVRTATAWGSLHAWATGEYGILRRYCAEVESIAERSRRHQFLLLEATAALSTSDDDPAASATRDALLDESRAANRALSTLADERQQAEDDLARTIHDIRHTVGPILADWSAPHFKAADYRDSGATQLLDVLDGFSPADLRLLSLDESLAARLNDLDPADVAVWWGRLSPTAQQRLVDDAPELIGNLEGVAYGARDRANRVVLTHRITELQSERKRLEEGAGQSPGLGLYPDHERLLAVRDQLAALTAVRSTLRSADAEVPRQLVTLEDLAAQPRATISVGDLDIAQHVTYLVPGMATTVANSMKRWTAAADDLQEEQRAAQVKAGRNRSLATIAWIGYTPPGARDVAGVLGEDLARKGGDLLADDLNGLAAVRGWPASNLHTAVVAHSYGTTTAAFALKKAHAGSFVMLGSAGLPFDVRRAGELNVPPGRVSASLSDRDRWAPIGQSFGVRREPTDGFDAEVFSSDEITTPEGTLHGVTGHGPLVHSKPDDGYSYLDANTAALRNSALASLGLEVIRVD